MSRRSANGRNLFNIQYHSESAASPYPGTAARTGRQSVTTALIDSRAATLPERGGFLFASIGVIETEPFGASAWRNLSTPSAFSRVTSRQFLRTTTGERPKCEYSMTRIHGNGQRKKLFMKNHKTVRNTFVTIGALLLLTQLLTAASFSTFDAPGAINGTFPSSINTGGVITGYFNDENFASHGFVRAQNGMIVTLMPPAP
jgi:hypothetical protein